MEVGGGGIPHDDKAKRMRDLLSSFYSPDHSSSRSSSLPRNTSSRFATLDTINTTTFDADQYMNLLEMLGLDDLKLVQKSNMEGLLHKHVEMAAEIKNLDTDLQMLVYENYNKFISATDAIKRMKNNIVGMETNMDQLLEKIMSVQSRSDGVNTSLFEKREHIEKLHRTRNLLRKIQFIYDLPTRLEKCIKSEAYADAVKFYTGAMPIFKAYGNSSFKECKRASEEAGKVYSDSESIQARAEAVILLKQLDFPVENLKVKLFEKLEQFLMDLHLESKEITNASVDANESSDRESLPDSTAATAHEVMKRISIGSHFFFILGRFCNNNVEKETSRYLVTEDMYTCPSNFTLLLRHLKKHNSINLLKILLLSTSLALINKLRNKFALQIFCQSSVSQASHSTYLMIMRLLPIFLKLMYHPSVLLA
ncbi:hypothetical protein ACJIZ3_011556 [Penstemon smallii]|uniref:Vacuolar protein sorting-associated protein 51 homolog n=1 Tax=Penstemon smallii TaxID=265156 RepID=A0ABD3UJF7_9LAMI